MELALGRLVVRRLASSPWVWLAGVVLFVLPWVLRHSGPLGVSSQPVDPQALTAESVFLWGLVGGWIALELLRAIEPWLERIGRGRHWRARVAVLVTCIAGPAPLALLPSLLPGGASLGTASLLPCAWIVAYLSAAAALVDCLRIPAIRSIAFLSLAWWLPALVPDLFGVASFVSRASFPALSDSTSGSMALGSTAPIGGFAPILALGLVAWGIDLLRRRSA